MLEEHSTSPIAAREPRRRWRWRWREKEEEWWWTRRRRRKGGIAWRGSATISRRRVASFDLYIYRI